MGSLPERLAPGNAKPHAGLVQDPEKEKKIWRELDESQARALPTGQATTGTIEHMTCDHAPPQSANMAAAPVLRVHVTKLKSDRKGNSWKRSSHLSAFGPRAAPTPG